MELPESWRFLGPMWWVLHIAAIGLVFYIGYVIGRNSADDASSNDDPGVAGWQSDRPDVDEKPDTPKE